MTVSNFFPPVSEPIRSIDWVKTRQLCLTSWRTLVTVTIWAVAITHAAGARTRQLWDHISPALASLMRTLADRMDPATAPLFEPITAADIEAMHRDQLLKIQKPRTDRPEQELPSSDELAKVGDILAKDLLAKPKAELMKLAGTKSRQYTKEQLVSRIQNGPAHQPKP